MVQQRSVGLAIILSLVTCGIYTLYWIYALTNDLGRTNNDPSFSGGKVLLLCLVTCGIYTYFWYYQLGKQLEQAQVNAGVQSSDDSVIYLILGIFGLGIVSSAIAQNNLNKLV